MPKVTLPDIASGYNLSAINSNFQKVEDELNNKVLYRQIKDGEPNAMSENLDMNSNEIINVSKLSANTLEIGGVQITADNAVVDPYNGTREALRRSYAEAGYNLVDGSFEAGGTVNNQTDVLLFEVEGKAYSYIGTLPHTVFDDSSPSAEPGMWIDRSQHLLSRRSTSYPSISAALSSGNDVIIGKDSTISAPVTVGQHQTLDGRGGKISTTGTRGFNVNGGRVENLNILGDITTTGIPNYSVSLNNDESSVDGVTAESSTGAVLATDIEKFNIKRVIGKGLVYHPTLVAGGYAVLLQSCGYGVVDGVIMEVDGPLDSAGRHMLYMSVNPANQVQQVGIVATRLVAKYNGRDNRNMAAIAVRANKHCVIGDFSLVGPNAGVILNPENGDIEYLVSANGTMLIEKYDSNPVYGESILPQANSHDVICNVFANKAIKVSPKSGLADYTGCHALSVASRNSIYSNYATAVPAESWPVLINAGAQDLLIDGVVDLIIPGGGGATEAQFRFAGACSRIKIRNVQTQRPMFSGIQNVTDLSVDFNRKANINSVGGVITTTDLDSLIESTAVSATNEITVVFKSHVTTKAVDTAEIRFTRIAAPHIAVSNITGKAMKLQFFSASGTSVPIASSTVGADIILHE